MLFWLGGKHPFHRLLEAEVLTPSARTTSWLAAFCCLYGSFVGSLAEVEHHKNNMDSS